MKICENDLLNIPLRKILSESKVFDEVIPFDEYHLMMAQSDLLLNKHEEYATKQYFYRLPPFGASYVISAGLSSLIAKLDNFSYKQILPYLERKKYTSEFISYIAGRDKIKVKLYAIAENSIAMPYEPIIVLETNLFDSRILEGIVLSEMNFASLSATKWHRIKSIAQDCTVMEFGRRRAQNSLKASLYSYMAGVDITSNGEADYYFGIPTSGTMGHEFIQSFESEEEAFEMWLKTNPDRPCLLIDTINTLESGIINAGIVFNKYKNMLINNNSWHKIGVRIDSGDLAYLAIKSYTYLQKELQTDDITIVLSNDLDEFAIDAIFSQLYQAGCGWLIKHISFGVGTKGATAWGTPALGGVCKISELGNKYILKISNNNDKTTIPGNLRSRFVLDDNNQYVTTLIHFHNEKEISGKLLDINDDTKYIIKTNNFKLGDIRQKLVYVSDGILSTFYPEYADRSLSEIRNNLYNDLKLFDWSYKRIIMPHIAKVSLSENVFKVRKNMIKLKLMQMDK